MRKFLKKILLLLNVILVAGTLFALYSDNIHPVKFWPAAFFGLAYIFFILGNILFLVFWAYRLKAYLIISLVTLIISWPTTKRLVQFKKSALPNKTEQSLSILSYNVRIFSIKKNGRFVQSYDTVLKKVNQISPDIACFQEFRVLDDKRQYNQKTVDFTLNDLPYHHFQVLYERSRHYRTGLAIYSKYPIIGSGKVSIEGSGNGCVFADILWENDTIRFFNAHLQSISLARHKYNFLEIDSLINLNHHRFDEMKDFSLRMRDAYKKRAVQVDILSEELMKSPFPVVLCGDFNDTPVSYTYNKLSKGLKDAFIESGVGMGKTYLGDFPSVRIDYILHSKFFKAYDYQSVDFRISDHMPITCKIAKRKREQN